MTHDMDSQPVAHFARRAGGGKEMANAGSGDANGRRGFRALEQGHFRFTDLARSLEGAPVSLIASPMGLQETEQ